MVRGDKYGQYQSLALEKGFAYHFAQLPDVSKATSREAVIELHRDAHPEAKEAQIRSWAAQLFVIGHRIKKGDLVAMPLRNSPQIAIGRVTGPYQYRTDLGDVHHTIPIEWLREDIPRTEFGQDLLYSIGSARTVCQVQRNNAEARVQEILKGNKDPGLTVIPGGDETGGEVENGDEAFAHVEQMARDQIMGYIEKHFKDHDLARIVDDIRLPEFERTAELSRGRINRFEVGIGNLTVTLIRTAPKHQYRNEKEQVTRGMM